MPKQQIGLKLDSELVEALDAKAERLEVTRTALIERGVELALQGSEVVEPLLLSVSQIQCLDQLAERAGVTRAALAHRWIAERLRREYVDYRNSKLQSVSRKA